MTVTVTELIEALQSYQKEIGCNGENIGSHKLKSYVRFLITNPDIDLSLEIDDSEHPLGIELDYLPGCSCPCGIYFNLKVVPD